LVTERGQVRWTPDGDSWAFSDALTNHGLTGIAFGNGSYVAVGTSKIVHSSTNLVQWVSSSLVVPQNPSASGFGSTDITLDDVVFAQSRFVAVGGYFQSADSIILSSEDAVRWTSVLPRGGKRLRAVHHAAGKFVAVGNDGEVATSTDGSEWVRRMSGIRKNKQNFRDVIFYAGWWIAVGNKGIICLSRDAEIWTVHQMPEIADLSAVGGLGDHLILVGESGFLWVSAALNPGLVLRPGPLVLDGKAGWSSRTLIQRSEDLQNWHIFGEFFGDSEFLGAFPLPSLPREFFRATSPD
jgi:hypothetical protein